MTSMTMMMRLVGVHWWRWRGEPIGIGPRRTEDRRITCDSSLARFRGASRALGKDRERPHDGLIKNSMDR